MGREQLLNQIATGSGSPSSSSTTKTTSSNDSKAAGRDRLLKQIGGYGNKTALDEDKYSEFEHLYNQYESDVSGIYDSYNARTGNTGYKADAQDFYDKTMAATTAARSSGSALTDWLKENRGSFSYDDYTELLDTVKQNDTGLSKIIDATKSEADYFGQFKDADDYDYWTGYQKAIEQYEQPASESMVAYNEDGSFNAWQTMLNAVQGGKDLLKETKTKEIGERYDADRKGETRTDALGIRRDVMKEYKAAGGKTVNIGGKDVALDAALYNQLYDQHPAPAQTQYELPEKYAAEYMKPQTDAARLLAETYGVSTGSIKDSRTQRNALDYEQKYADMDFGERMLHNIPITAANYMLDMYSAGLTTADALTGGKLGRGELGDASSVYSLLNFAQNAGSGLTAEAFGVMRDSSNWLGKLVLDLEKTGVEQTMDRALGAGEGSLAMMGIRVFGSGAQEAEDKGKSLGKQILTGFTRSGIEVATELMGGVGGSWRGTGYGDGVLKSLNSWVSSKTGSELLGTLTEAFSGEAIEEMMSDVLNPLADRIFQLSDGDQTFWQEVWGDGQILYDGLLGGLAGMGGGVQTHVGNWMQAKNLGTDIATYKAAQRIAESKNLREKFEEYTGDKLDSDTDTAITQIAVAITNAADTAGEATNAHDVERDIETGGDRYRTTAADEQTGSSAPVNTQAQSAPTAQTDTETGTQTATQQARPTGAMEAIYKGQVGNVVSLTKTDKGWAATIEQPNGKRSNVMEWQAVFDQDTQGILDAFRPSAYADEMLKTYALTDEQAEPKTYALAFNTVADIYGKSTSLTKQQAQEASRRDGGAAAILTDEQFSRAFDAGRNSKDSSIQNSVTRKSSKGAVGFKGVQYQGMTYRAATKDMVSEAELSVLKTVSKAVGVDMVLYQSEAQNGEYQGANGFYRNGTMYLDVHAGANKTTEQSAILLTAAHELTHYLRENNAEAYAGLRDFVTKHLIESGTDIEALAQRKIDREGGTLSMEDAAEEVIADSCEMMLENTQVPQMMAKENPGLFAQIREWLAEFTAKLRKAFEGVQARSTEAQAMMQYAEELQQMWDNALAGAAQNVRNNAKAANNGTEAANNGTTSGNNKRSIREIGDTGKRYVKADRQVLFGNDPREWGEQLTKYINKEIRKGNDVLLTAPDGEIIKLTATTAEKGAFRNTWYDNRGIPHLLTDAEYETKLNAEAHIDELVQVSEDKYKGRPNVPDDNGVHGGFAKDGWRYRQAYFMDHDGQYYDLTLSVAYGRNGKVAYNVAGIKKRSFPEKHGSSNPKTGALGKTSLNERVPQPTGEVKGKSSMRERDNAADVKTAEKYFGTTYKIAEAGYLLTDGKLLDFSGRHEGAPGGYRSVDHRDISDAFDGDYGDDSYTGGMIQFMQAGNIRLSPESGGINLSVKPNKQQLDTLDRYISSFRGEVILDIDNANGDTVVSVEYPKRTYSKRIINDINEYFDNGTIPEQSSDLGQFRYSMRDNTTDDTAAERKGRQESYANLRAENAKLREQLDYWKGQTKLTKEKTVRKADVDAYAKRLTEQLHNPKAREQVADEIKRMGDYIVQTPGSELNYNEIKDYALAIADFILRDSQTVIDDSQAESLQQLYGYLKDNKLKVTDDTFNDLPEGWVRQHRGRIRLSEEGLDVDTAWGELQEKFGEGMFPSDITAQADMLMHIADTIEAMKPTYGNPFAGYMGEMREAVAQDILDTVLSDEIRQTAMTAADRAQARLDRRIAQDTARYNALRDAKNARIEQVYQEGVARRQEAVAKERAAKWAKVAETKQYYQNMAQQAAERRRESADLKKYRDRVAATAEQLSDWLLKNSDKEHVPEALKQVVGEFLSTIDFSSKSRLQGGENTYNDRQFLQRLDRLEQMLRNQRDYLNSGDNQNADRDTLDIYLDIPTEMLDELRDIRSEVTRLTTRDGGYTINQMSAGELRRLDAVLSAISHSIRKANTLFANAQYNSVQQVAQKTITEMDALGEQTKETTGAGRFFQWDNATPYYAFKKLGAGARSIFKGLMQGWDKMAFNSKEIIDFTNKLYTAKEAREWQKKIHNVKIGNKTVQITTTQLMSLHCLVKRPQAMQHIMGGGFKVSVIKQSGIGKADIAQTMQYKPTLDELAMLDSLLTDRQRKVADELQKFMVDVCGEWGNEVSMKRFGYRAFGEANYFPIVSDANVLKAVDPEAKANDMFRLLNMSATKSLNVKANNALVVSDIFEVFTNHSADMAKYNALALPLLDAIKWYNYKESTKTASGRVFTNTVQLSLETAYGNAAKAYITKFIKDLNGVREGGTSQSDKLAKRMVSRYKAAAVGANIRVAIQQPTAYVRAAMAIDPKYLAAALKPGGHKASTAEMEKYSGIATWKGLGFVSTDIGRSMRSQIMHTESKLDTFTDASMFLAEKGDSVTWSALWRACKLETQEKTELRGEELNKATADRFQEVIYQTQVVDATMTRSQAMRSQGTMEAITTSFMAEPTLSYNLMLDAYAEYQAEARRTGNKAAALQHIKGKLAKTIAIYAASGAATLIASSFWDAWRDDDDYETFLQKWAQAFFGEAEDKWYEKPLLQELFLLNKLPGAKDIISLLTGDDVSRMDLEGAKNLIKAWRIMSECLKLATGKLEEQDAQYGNMTGYGKLANILKGISQFTGLPLYNATRDVVAVWNTLLSNVTGVKLTVYKPNSKREIKNAYVNGLMTDEQAMDELVKQGAADDADQAFWIINDWNGDGSSSDKMSEIYDAVRAGDTGTYEALVKELTDHGVFETKIQNDVKNQIRDWYQGGDTTQATISKQDALDLLQKYGGKAEKAADTLVEQWTCEKVTGISYWNIGDEYINGNISEARALELQAKYGYGDVTKQTAVEIASNQETAHDKLMQWKLEKETGISSGGDSFTGIREAYNAGKISKQEVYDYRIKYAGDTPEQAANTAYRYEWIGGDTRMNSVTGNQAHRYDDYVAASGMSKIDYWNAIDGHGASSFPADLVEGSKTRYVKNSKRDKIWDYVDSLDLTPKQKDALATAYAYDVNADVKSTSAYFDFKDAPWNK